MKMSTIFNQNKLCGLYMPKVHYNMLARMAWRKTLLSFTPLLGCSLHHKFSSAKQDNNNTDYDVAVIGGGSGGIAFSFQAQNKGLSTVLFDYVQPTIHGTKWGVGGTCVNVGCIPKKLFHQSAILGEHLMDSTDYGWQIQEAKREGHADLKKKFSWQQLVRKVTLYIKSLNFGYKNNLEQNGVKYINAFATLVDKNTILYSSDKATIKKFIETGEVPNIKENSPKCGILKVKNVVIATGSKPTYLDIQGKDLAITSDDIFWKKTSPGRTLIVGGGYVAVEIAGFLAEFGLETSMMTRSDYLRSFDKDIVQMLIKDLKSRHVKIIDKSLPNQMKRQGTQIVVKHCKSQSPEQCTTQKYDTVLFAIGRNANTEWLNLERLGVHTNKNTKKIKTNSKQIQTTNVQGIYAIGDVVDGVPQLTGTVQKAALFLARRIAHRLGSSKLTERQFKDTFIDFKDYPTTIFTPLEYSVCGMSEEQAEKHFGKQNIQVYHSKYLPLEESILDKYDEEGNDKKIYSYIKVITDKQGKVHGLHYTGPNAGQVMQGYAVAMRMGLTKQILDRTIGIHPTVSEQFTSVKVTKASGKDAQKKGC